MATYFGSVKENVEPCPTSLVEESLKHINQLPFLVQPCVALPILD